MYHVPVVMLDFETTGLSPASGARITEVAALRIAGGRVVERFVTLVNCGVRVPPFIADYTGITQDMVDGAPCVSRVMPELVRFIGADALAAHNASFDEKFLKAEAARLDLAPSHAHLLCSVKLARRLLPGQRSYGLSALAAALGIGFSGRAHRAEADAEVSAELMLHLGARVQREYGIHAPSPAMFAQLARLAAAKVPAFLHEQKSGS
jgi:DNA polymerase III subunit epsilon